LLICGGYRSAARCVAPSGAAALPALPRVVRPGVRR
jgi:hypothetical protein